MLPVAARPFVRHRAVIAVATLVVILLGLLALGRLPIDLPPARDVPRLRVQVSVPGVTAPVIVEKITRPLEVALTGSTGVTAVESVTTSGGVFMNLYLRHRRDAEAAQQDVTARLGRAKSFLPPSVDLPAVSAIDDSSIVAEFAITSHQHDLLALRDWVEDEFVKKLQELPGVSAVDVAGGAVREILVMPDQRRLAGLGLSFGDLLRAIRKSPEADAGTRPPPVQHGGRREKMQSGNTAAVAAMPVVLPSGESIPLTEVARITLVEEMKPDRFRFDGVEAIKVTLHKQPRAAASDVDEQIQTHVDWMRANRLIPEGIEIHSISQRLDEARQSLRRIALALAGGVSLVLLAAYLLLGNGRQTLILGVVIVATLQAVFAVMAVTGLTLNVMTLSGLALGTGLFGGCAVLLLGNTTRAEHDLGPAVKQAIGLAVAPAVSLLPVLFVGGEMDALFREFVLVFGGALIVSVLFSLMLVPAFDVPRRRQPERWHAAVGNAMARARRSYGSVLRRLLRHPSATLVVALVLAGAMSAALLLKRQAFPPSDVQSHEAVVLRIQGLDAGRLDTLGNDIVRRLRALPELREVKYSAQTARAELAVHLDEARAHELGIDVTDAGRALAVALTGIPAGNFRDAEHRYDIRLRLPSEESGSAAALGRILLLGELNDRPAVHLHDVATVEREAGPAEIRRYDGMPMIEVTAVPAAESSWAQASADVHAALSRYVPPAGYRIFYGPPGKSAEESRDQGLTGLGWTLLFVCVALVLLLRSLRLAVLVTLGACFSLVGVGAAVTIANMPLSSSAWLGAMIIIGIAAGYSAVPAINLTAQNARGLSPSRTIVPACKHLFRPLLILTLTIMLGMTPLLSAGDSAAMLHPLIVTITIGLVVSLAIGLLLMPPLYLLTRRKEQGTTLPRL